MGNFTINALSSQGSQRSLDKAGRVLENSELHCSALLTSCSRLLKLTVTEQIDTTTAGGELIFHIFGALASFERQLLRERTAAGLAAARERGKVGGRPAALSPAKKREATRMRSQGSTVGDIADVLGVSKRTLYRHFHQTARP